MSIRAMAWTLEDSGLNPTDRFIATALAYHANEVGEDAFPSLATLSNLTGYDRRTVARSMTRLRSAGIIEQTGTRGTGTLVYRFPMRSTRGTESPRGTVPIGRESLGAENPPARGTAPPDPPLTVSSNNPPVVPPEVAALNGRTAEVVERFKLVARERKGKALKVDVPRLLRVLADHAHLPSLYDESIKCAEWLGSERGRSRTDAPRTLRNWLDGKVKDQPKSESSDDWRRQWTAFAERKRQEQAAA